MKLRIRSPWRAMASLAMLLAVACGASTSLGAAIHYGDLIGESLLFQGITEDSPTDTIPLYGSPTMSAGALSFNPVSFNASSTSGQPAMDCTTGDLSMDILALGGRHIASITVREGGDYVLAGLGTVATRADASATLCVSILEIDGTAITPLILTESMTFNPNADGNFNPVDDPGVGVLWDGLAAIDIASALADEGIAGNATKVSLAVSNILTATTEPLTVAHIAKKQFGIEVTTQIGMVPEPTCLVLLACGALGLLPIRRRTK